MANDFKEAATALKGKAVLVDVDATVEKDLAEEYGVRGFPTLKLFSNGEVIADYKGGRTKDAFVDYIERALLPSIDQCADEEAVAKFIKENSGKNLFLGASLDKMKSAYKKVSVSLRDIMPKSVAFGSVEDVALLKSAAADSKVEADTVLLVREDGSTDVYTGDADSMESWMKVNALPLFGELSRESASIYTELPKPIFMLFQDPAEKDEKMNEEIAAISKEMRASGELAFTWVNAIELKQFKEHVGAAKSGIVIYKFDQDVKYVFNEDYSTEALKKWIDAFVKGDIKPTTKSEPIPEKNDEPVKIVVGDSWAKIVEDESKDVLIEQYAPWCGHCKKLGPVLDELAKDLAGVETLVIAKMDATGNDAPVEYKAKGFPTMHFFPAGKSEGIAYEGGRTKEDFIKFFKEHATHKAGLSDTGTEETKGEDAKTDEKDEL